MRISNLSKDPHLTVNRFIGTARVCSCGSSPLPWPSPAGRGRIVGRLFATTTIFSVHGSNARNSLWRNVSACAVSLLALAGCSTTHPVAGTKSDSETVMVTYHVLAGKEAEFEALLAHAWETYRSGHLVYSDPHIVVRDSDGEDNTKYVEIFTWSKSPDHPTADVLAIWKQEQSLCESRDGHRGIEGGEVNLVTGK